MIKTIQIIVAAGLLAATLAGQAQADAIGDWRKNAVKQVSKNKVYPRSAISREIEGRAMILVNVAANGAITGHKVLQGTGETVLDREIPKILERAGKLEAVPAGKGDQSVVVPLVWTLN